MMTIDEELFARHRGRSVLLDSNLFLVLLAGKVGVALFEKFERVNRYTFNDYEFLVRFLSLFRTLLTTPHVLTEVSNLAIKLSGSYRDDWFQNIRAFVASGDENAAMQERWTPVRELAAMPEFVRFGITDSAVTRLALEALVVTDDYRLSGTLRSRGIDVLNFRDLQAVQRWIQ